MDVMVNRSLLVLVTLLLAELGGGGSDTAAAQVWIRPRSPRLPLPPLRRRSPSAAQVTFDLVPAVAGHRARLRQHASAARARRDRRAASERRDRDRVEHDDRCSGQLFLGTRRVESRRLASRAGRDVAGRVRRAWTFAVVDNVNGDALYCSRCAVFNTGIANVTRNLHAASGWGGAALHGERSAAPFAILDPVYDAVQLVLTAAPR